MVLFETLLAVATEQVGAALLSGISAKLNPKDIELFLKQAIQTANDTHPELFSAYEQDGLKGYGKFLNQFFKGRALAELQKPLEGSHGKPNVSFLAEAFWREASEHSQLKTIEREKIEPWMQIFVETYFQATNRSLQFQLIKDDYCEQIRRVFDDVRFAGIAVEGQDIDQSGRLVEIFVMPDVEEEDSRLQETSEEMPVEGFDNTQQRLLWEQRQQILQAKRRGIGRKFSAADLLAKGKSKRVVLLGSPGSGKTTLLNYFAVVGTVPSGEVMQQELGKQCSYQTIAHSRAGICLPVIIRIRDLALNPDLSILDYIQQFTTKDLSVSGDLTGFFEYFLENGNALILLDGLDEVADIAQRYKVVEKIEAFLSQFEQCPTIITSRPAGYRRDFFRTDEYPHYELQPFDD